MNKRSIGGSYEALAADYLLRHNYLVLERNFNCRFGEIDLIASKNGYLIFVEVKYRKNASSGYPEEALSLSKIKHICKSADLYRIRNRISETIPCRFDVIAIQGNDLRHHKDAFPYYGLY